MLIQENMKINQCFKFENTPFQFPTYGNYTLPDSDSVKKLPAPFGSFCCWSFRRINDC